MNFYSSSFIFKDSSVVFFKKTFEYSFLFGDMWLLIFHQSFITVGAQKGLIWLDIQKYDSVRPSLPLDTVVSNEKMAKFICNVMG